jgi:putative sterol carrier protein
MPRRRPPAAQARRLKRFLKRLPAATVTLAARALLVCKGPTHFGPEDRLMNYNDILQRFQSGNVTVPGKKVKFDFGDAGKIYLDGVGNKVTNEDGAADTTIKVKLDDFVSMAEGQLDPTAAFMQGKLRVEGDMGVAMQLQGVMAKLRG